jgi:hypothetical protein
MLMGILIVFIAGGVIPITMISGLNFVSDIIPIHPIGLPTVGEIMIMGTVFVFYGDYKSEKYLEERLNILKEINETPLK